MCPEEQLSAYMDEELNEEERLEIESHLAHCQSCRLLLNEFMELKQSYSAEMFALAEPAGFENRVMQAVAHESKIRNLGKLWLLVPLLAAVVVILLTIAAWPVAVHFMNGAFVIGKALLFTIPHAVSSMPVVAGVTVALSLTVLVVSFLSLRRLLRSATV
ncbi:zf-HC2 domain-containing protein [Paenibacillus chitinolyticus]|uniref:zf-HC2 domain-containing protein n=1 Tax=Paenibacillus chitinolyticus TaxID=79263 RepID=UPI00366E65C7